MINKVLIANRGEIALRIIRACKELGIDTVAVYSEADKESLHVRFADEAICIGPPPASESYLNMPRLISAAEISNADSIHPGYGFLAENADFSEMCESSDITFIGPTAKMISNMGDKIFAKKVMQKAGVPVIPGSEGAIKDKDEAISLAKDIVYPVIIKAAAGGGGKGMRIIRDDKEMAHAFNMARSEAKAAFGNPDLYMEKYFESPRHIEVQLLGDGKGKVVALGERECSIQRKHQKLIEESPSPIVNVSIRQQLTKAAVSGAESVGYRSAGTIEFLMDQNKNFYFMEMNTRIQVEHPVTEMVYNIDLLKEQMRVAAEGNLNSLNLSQGPQGHAIECRINAEDPFNNFLPRPGIITSFHEPGGMGVRVDTHAYAQYKIPSYYDSLLAKLITYGINREEAISRMKRSLEEFIIEGIPTTIPFHKQVMHDENFVKGNIDTHFIDNFKLEPEQKE